MTKPSPTPAGRAAARRNTPHTPPLKPSDSGFAYSRDFFESLVDSALDHAKKLAPPMPVPRCPKAVA